MNKDIIKKTVIIGIALVLVFVAFIPTVNSQLSTNFSVSSIQKEHTKDDSQEFVDNLDSKLNAEEATNPLPLETGNWWNDSWSYRKNITIDHTKVDDDFINFPVLISLPSDDDLASKAQNNGSDIVFTDYSGNKLNHEIELFNGSNGELVAWVNVTSLSSIMNTTLYVYYGNPSANNQQNTTGAWDSHFTLVQHLNETSGTHCDSTTYDNDGTPKNGVNQTAVGKIDGADEFDDVDDYIIINDSVSLDLVNLTIESWFNDYGAEQGARGTWQGIVSKRTSAWTITTDPQNYWPPRLIMYIGNKRIPSGAAAEITFNEWYHAALVINGSTARLYLNGQNVVTDTSVTVISTNSDLYIGRNQWNEDDLFNGTIDEIRISNIARDGGWINTSYNNQNEPNTFYSIGGEEVFNNPPYEPSNPYPVNGSYNVDINVNLSWAGGDPDGDSVTYDVYFGNSSPPPKVVDNQTNNNYNPEILFFNITYYWQIVAWDNHSAFTKGPIWWFSTVDNHPPDNPIILGPAFGKPGIKYNFRTQLTDPDEDSMFCMWDWGDGSYSAWLGPFDSGKYISASHTWSTGIYGIRVKAKDVHSAESKWSDPLLLVIEDEPPNIEIIKPEKALYIRNRKILPRLFRTTLIIGKIEITADAVDEYGVKKVEFYIDNELKTVDESFPFVHIWTRDKITLFGHRHTIKVIAFDKAGNTATAKIIVRRFF